MKKQLNIKKNDVYEVTITDLNDEGLGVAKIDGQVIFVPNALPNEIVKLVIIFVKSSYAIGKVLEWKNTSKHRVSPPCPYFPSCGGCDLQHIEYSNQLEFKKRKVEKTVTKFLDKQIYANLTESRNNVRYRNKISLPINEKLEIGMYRKNTHNILPIEDCIISKEWTKNLINCVQSWAKKKNISGYNESTKVGILRHLVAREIDGKVLITVVINSKKLPYEKELIDTLSKHFKDYGLNYNINLEDTNVILSNKFVPIYGFQQIIVKENNLTFPVSNASFYQVNTDIQKAIYNRVLDIISCDDIVIDLYSGTGLLTAKIAQKAKKAIGVEIVKEATQNANELKAKNNLANMENINGDAKIILPQIISQLKTNNNLKVVLDPPRKGCDNSLLETLNKYKPQNIIYISCNPNTLARDLSILSNNYEIMEVTPYDMFPQTYHIETLAILKEKTNND